MSSVPNSAGVRPRLKTPWVVIWAVALLLTLAVGSVIAATQVQWVAHHPFFFDPASYQMSNAELFEQVASKGRAAAFGDEMGRNSTHPLRTLPLAAFCPSLLASPHGHLATALPMFFVFAGMLGVAAFHRTHSLGFAAAAVVVAGAAPGLFKPRMGLGAYWLDFPAGLLVAAAALAILCSWHGRRCRWLAVFAVLISLATLSRYVASVFGFCVCAPLLVYDFVKRLRAGESWRFAVWQPVGLITGIIGLLAGPFLAAHFFKNTDYYSNWGYGYKSLVGSFGFCLNSIGKFLSVWDPKYVWLDLFAPHQPQFIYHATAYLIGRSYLLVLVIIGALNIVGCIRQRRAHCGNDSMTGSGATLFLQWGLPLSVVAFLALSQQVGEASHATLYAVPLVITAALLPAGGVTGTLTRRWLVGLLVGASLAIGGIAALEARKEAIYPDPNAAALRATDVALADAFHDEGGARIGWMTYFDERFAVVKLQQFYRHGSLAPAVHDDALFTNHDAHLAHRFPGQSSAEICRSLYAAAGKHVDVAVICADPVRIGPVRMGKPGPQSKAVATYFSETMPGDPDWQRAFAIDTPYFGRVIGYRNLLRRGQLAP